MGWARRLQVALAHSCCSVACTPWDPDDQRVFGTVISLERAVALKRRWALGAPALTVLGILLLGAGKANLLGSVLILLGSVGMTIVFGKIVQRQPATFTAIIMP